MVSLLLTHALCDGLSVAEGEEDDDERREEGRLDEVVAAQAHVRAPRGGRRLA